MNIAQCFALLAALLTLGGCTLQQRAMRADFTPAPRYPTDPPEVAVVMDKDKPVLVSEQGRINRPWRVIGVYTASPFAPPRSGARLLGCDAYFQNHQVHQITSHQTVITWQDGALHGVGFGYGDQLCIQFLDKDAIEQRRKDERAWQWTAYQRPPIGAGWSINFVGGFDPFRADPNRTTSVQFAGLSVEKYFRKAPIGFGLRLDFPDQRDRGGIMPGISLYAPLLSMWRAQLTAMGGFEYALVGNGSGGSVHGPRFAGGANVDLVLGRVCCMVGTGFEYWFSPNAAIPHGPAILARFGFPF